MVKTITLTAGAVTTVEFSASYQYYWINNMSESVVYASLSTPIADADDTYTIPSGTQMRVAGGVAKGVNLLGSGKVQVIASENAFCPFKISPRGGESGTAITVDSELDASSENPVQNKVITAALGGCINAADMPLRYTLLKHIDIADGNEQTFDPGNGAYTYFIYAASGLFCYTTFTNVGYFGTFGTTSGQAASVTLSENSSVMSFSFGVDTGIYIYRVTRE